MIKLFSNKNLVAKITRTYVYRERREVMLKRMRKNKELLTRVEQRKTEYYGHLYRNDKYKKLQLITKAKLVVVIKDIRGLKTIRDWTHRYQYQYIN